MAPADLTQAPNPDEVEVSIFGPGVGECIVLHLGNNDWVIIDSCEDEDTGRPVALDYLTRLGVDVSTRVKVVVMTHWHDDHTRGAVQILRAAPSATIVCSAALRTREFFKLTRQAKRANESSGGQSGVDEFTAILDLLRERAAPGSRSGSVGPRWTMEDQTIFLRPATAEMFAAEVKALSPSPGTLSLAYNEFNQLLLDPDERTRRLIAQRPNKLAVVAWARVGNLDVLLGADLEETKSLTTGWQAVVASPWRPQTRARIFKVPHHGSVNAHSDAVWEEMLDPQPVALVAPFGKGVRPLPSPADIERLSKKTQDLYCTAPPTGWSPPKRESAVEKTMNEVVRDRRVYTGKMGQVRVRARAAQAPPVLSITRSAGAVSLRP